jgi:hypothetical protein
MDEPVIARATLRIEYADGRVQELDVLNPVKAQVEVTSPDLPPLPLFDPAHLHGIPAHAAFWSVQMTLDAAPSENRRNLITRSENPYVLDPALMPYLDCPLYFPDMSVYCNNPAHDSPYYIASQRRVTVRELLAMIRKHAEEIQ